MARRSARPGRKDAFRLADTSAGTPAIEIGARVDGARIGVSISLQHYRQETECFSSWGEADLKKFGAVVAKLRGYSLDDLRRSRLCEKHKTDPAEARFARPDTIARDAPMYEIRVDMSNLARIHGVFENDVFHLVWLDRRHRVFPQ